MTTSAAHDRRDGRPRSIHSEVAALKPSFLLCPSYRTNHLGSIVIVEPLLWPISYPLPPLLDRNPLLRPISYPGAVTSAWNRWLTSVCGGCHGGWAHTFCNNELMMAVLVREGCPLILVDKIRALTRLECGVGRAEHALELKHAHTSVPCWFIFMRTSV